MGEAEEVERDAVRIRVAYAPRPMKAKVDEVRLVQVERKPVPCKPPSQHVHDPLGVVETLERRQAGHGRAGKAACTVRAYAPPGQDAPRRLSLSSAGGRMPPGYGQRHVQLPRLLPYLGQVKEGGERGEAS